MFSVRSAVAALALAASAVAHFQITYPDYRGTAPDGGEFNEGNQTALCAGLPESEKRSSLSLTNGVLAINNGHDEGVVFISLSLEADPQDFSAFNSSESKEGVTVFPFFEITGVGIHCFAFPDLSKLGVDGLKDGANATILVAVSGHSELYNCADVTFTSNTTSPSKDDLKCINPIYTVSDATKTQSSGPSNTGNPPAATSPGDAAFQVTGSKLALAGAGVFAALVAMF